MTFPSEYERRLQQRRSSAWRARSVALCPKRFSLVSIKMPFSALLYGPHSVHNPMLCRRALRYPSISDPRSSSLTPSRQTLQKQLRTPAGNDSRTVCHAADTPQAFDTGRNKGRLPTQGESVVLGSGGSDTMLQDLPKPPADIDYLAVSIASIACQENKSNNNSA